MFRKIFGWFILSILVFMVLNILYRRYQQKRHFELVNAVIVRVGTKMEKSGDWDVEYKFNTKSGKEVNASEGFMIYYDKRQGLIGRVIPCAYYKEDSSRSELLIYKQTWEQHGLRYPDSLSWVKEYFKEIIYSY